MKKIAKGLVFGAIAVSALACNQNPLQKPSAAGAIEYQEPINVDGSTQIDMLWVIDNSGSMCQEQETLAKNFKLFVDEIEATNLDFHIAVTTTHMPEKAYPQEPLAIPGHIQSTPQPIPGFDQTCIKTVDDMGKVIEGQFDPLKESIAAAVKCMVTPDESFNSFSNADFICATQKPEGCEIAGVCGGATGTRCEMKDLFPTADQYRQIPKVLKSSDYRLGNGLDVDRLKDDFACASFVGTRGHGIEKGLAASLEATKIELTGGPVDDDTAEGFDPTAPNHGFLRKNSRFALIFVTDENDCSHDGTLNEESTCNDDVCEFANIEGEEDSSPLLKIEDMKNDLFKNLQKSKNRPSFGEGEILVASIHGKPERFAGPKLEMCEQDVATGVRPVCANRLGIANSGDRYTRFLQSFGEGQYFPRQEDNTQGWLCVGDFSPALTAIGQFVGNIGGGCISRSIYPCTDDGEQCPNFPFSETPGACVDRPGSDGEKYCSSGIQVRVALTSPTEENLEGLKSRGYCVEGSVGHSSFPSGCIISPSKYAFDACPAGLEGVKLVWNDEADAKNALVGTSLEIRYNALDSNE